MQLIPLSHIVPPGDNVRTTPAGKAALEELKSSILSVGQISSIAVREVRSENQDEQLYRVVAGARRHQAMMELRRDDQIPEDFLVACQVIKDQDDTEVSLAENVCRVAMDPLDACNAFVRLLDDGLSIDDVAKRFGVGARTVRQRLQLTKVAPQLTKAYRAGEISIGILQEFANTNDHDRQITAWERSKEYGYSDKELIRVLIRKEAVPATSNKVFFVGRAAYEEAGGRVETNLFGDDDQTFYLDVEILDGLVIDKLRKHAGKLAKKWKWVDCKIQNAWDEVDKFARVEPTPGENTAAEKKRIGKLSAEIKALEVEKESGNDKAEDLLYKKSDQVLALQAKAKDRGEFSAAQRKMAGCFVSLGSDGRPQVDYGLVRDEDITKDDLLSSADEKVEIVPSKRRGGGADKHIESELDKAGIGKVLAEELRCVRLALIQAHLAADPMAALDLLLFSELNRKENPTAESVLDARFQEPSLYPSKVKEPEDREAFKGKSPGIDMLTENAAEAPWPDGKDVTDEQRFESISSMDIDDKMRLLAVLVASSLKPQLGIDPSPNPIYERAVDGLDIDFTGMLRPTADLYWARMSKDKMIEVANAVLGREWASTVGALSMKRSQLALAMGEAFSDGGTQTMTPEQKLAAAEWSIPGMKPRV